MFSILCVDIIDNILFLNSSTTSEIREDEAVIFMATIPDGEIQYDLGDHKKVTVKRAQDKMKKPYIYFPHKTNYGYAKFYSPNSLDGINVNVPKKAEKNVYLSNVKDFKLDWKANYKKYRGKKVLIIHKPNADNVEYEVTISVDSGVTGEFHLDDDKSIPLPISNRVYSDRKSLIIFFDLTYCNTVACAKVSITGTTKGFKEPTISIDKWVNLTGGLSKGAISGIVIGAIVLLTIVFLSVSIHFNLFGLRKLWCCSKSADSQETKENLIQNEGTYT